MRSEWRNAFRSQFCQLVYAVLVLHLAVRNCCCLNFEGLALLAFRGRVKADPYSSLSNWNPYDEDPCKWYGVHCIDGKVISLELAELSLQGILAPELGQLIHLQKLTLCENKFSGTIPKELGELENLELLNLRHNDLIGQIPSDLGNISTLKSLLLSNNQLDGSIPPELGNLVSLCELQLDRNQLSGVIPGFDHGNRKLGKSISLCDLKYLKKADFSFNYIGGEVPACLYHLPWSCFKWNCLQDQTPQQHLQRECGYRGLHMLQGEWREVPKRARVLADSNNVLVPPRLTSQAPAASKPGSSGEAPAMANSSPSPSSPSPSPLSPSPATSLSPSFTPSALPKSSSPSLIPSSSPVSSPAPLSVPSPKPSSVSPVPVPAPLPYLLAPPSRFSGAQPSLQSRPSSPKRRSISWIYHIAAPVVAFLLVSSVIIICICRNRSMSAIRPWKTGISGQLQKAFVTGVPKLNRVELEAACEEFSNIIGSSPDSMVFKGTLSSGVEIAVTSSTISSANDWSARSEYYFRQKIEILSRMNHKNLVNLLGYCEEEEPFTRMMVFEYAPNGTLFEHLHNKEAEHLDWATRMRIIMGIAYCLQYMHHELELPITYPSLHSNAVYLTDDYAAKLAGLGLWKEAVVKSEKMQSFSNNGNLISYDDIELSGRHSLEVENNVYGFGVLMLEIISGKLPYMQEQGLLINWAMEYLGNNHKLSYIVDPSLKNFKYNELEIICEVVQCCIHPDQQQRPSMRDITSKLREVLSISPDAACPKLSPLWWAELEILSQDGS
eukprot:Gb_21863 [translate_table: standard]